MARKTVSRYEDNDAVLFLTFDVYADSGKAEEVEIRALHDVDDVMRRATNDLLKLGFHGVFYVPGVHVIEM